MALSARQILDFAYAAGFTGADLVTAVAIALAESSGDPTALNPNFWTLGQVMNNGQRCGFSYCGDYSLGLWQINMRPDMRAARLAAWSLPSLDALYDPATNARVAYALYAGRGGVFTDWATYNNGIGTFLNYVPAAKTAYVSWQAEQANPAVVDTSSDASPPNPSTGPTPRPVAAGSSLVPAPQPGLLSALLAWWHSWQSRTK